MPTAPADSSLNEDEFVSHVRDVLDRVYRALIELDDADRIRDSDGNPDTEAIMRCRGQVDTASAAALRTIGAKMIPVATKYHMENPADWGYRLGELLAKVSQPATLQANIGKVLSYYHAANVLANMLGTGPPCDPPPAPGASSNNPVHFLISTFVQFHDAVVRCHNASTKEEREQTLSDWNRTGEWFWPTYRIPAEAVRRLADPAIAWCSHRGYRDIKDVVTVENVAQIITDLARIPVPCACPQVYSNAAQASQQWDAEGRFLLEVEAARDDLRRLAARTGEPWSAISILDAPKQRKEDALLVGTARSVPVPESLRAARMIKVLLLSANPIDAPLSIDEEFRAIDAKIRASDHRDHVQLIPHGAVRLEDIPGLLMRHKPHVVHLSGHGDSGAIELTSADERGHLVQPDTLTDIFRVLKDNVRVVLLNACDSAPQAAAIVSVIDCAVGMSEEIEDGAAIAFSAAFYEALGYGRSVQDAFDLALVQLTSAGADRSLAKLHKRRGVKPSDIILVPPHHPQ